MAMQQHLETLRSKHASLDQQLSEEQHRPRPDQGLISRLKREKLRIKEEIEHAERVVGTSAAVA